uniref:Ig-like domain-containing protein n=1 Tax=Ditylenchus dipsaci TaxID=166011 RepID=A0A915E018_9BILA
MSAPELYENVRTRFRVQVGSKPFKLVCPIKSPDPQGIPDGTMVRWTKDGERGSEWGNAQYKLLNFNRDLKIRSPQLSDTGHYKCMAVNGFGHKEVEFSLEVFDPNHQFQSPRESLSLSELSSSPVWYDRSAMDRSIQTPVKLQPGARLELSCPAQGNPLPSISWKKNGKVINPELTNPTSAKFTVEHVNAADSGIYSCRLENIHGSLDADFHVTVGDWTSEPAIDMHSGTFGASSAVIVSYFQQFQCKVQWRKEIPMIRWLRKVDDPMAIRAMTPNATILHINDMHLVVLEQKNDAVQVQGKDSEDSSYTNQLVISNVQQQDSGRYFCVVTNAAGQFVYRSAYLEVVETVRFSPMGDAPNIIIGVVVACMLTLVCISVLWLCCNGTKSGEGSTTATFSSSSTSTTSTTKCAPLHPQLLLCSKVLNKPPPPRIPLPMAPPISPPPAKFNASLMPIQHSTPQPHRHIWHDELGNASQAGFHSATMDRRYRPRPNSQHNMALHRTRRKTR